MMHFVKFIFTPQKTPYGLSYRVFDLLNYDAKLKLFKFYSIGIS